MDSKFSVWPTIREHYGTYIDDETKQPLAADYLTSLGLPVAAGLVVAGVMKWRTLSMTDVAAYIGGVAIFTALLFALVIYVFQLRMQLDADDRVSRTGKLVRLIDQLFSNVNYAVVVGIVTTTVAMIAAAFATNGDIGPYWTGVLAALGLHLVLSVFMCIKRVQAAYREIRRLPRVTSV